MDALAELTSELPPPSPSPSPSRLHLLSLPPEILQLIAVNLRRRRSVLEPGGLDQVYEEEDLEEGTRPALACFSEVSRVCYNASLSLLWEQVNMSDQSNADYLYLLHAILPRHGPHIRTLVGTSIDIHDFPRSYVPEYIAEALGISSRLDYPSPPTRALDHQLLGEEVILPPFEDDEDDAEFQELVRDTDGANWEAQRTTLIRMILSSPHFSRLDNLSVSIDSAEDVVSKLFATIREALSTRKTRLTTLKIRHWDMHLRSMPSHQAGVICRAALAGLLDACPHLTELDLVSEWRPHEEHADPVSHSLKSLKDLKRLTLHRPSFDSSWSTSSSPWASNLTHLKLQAFALDTSREEFVGFLHHFNSSLTSLHINFDRNSSSDTDSTPFTSTPTATFPHLDTLILDSSIPAGFVELFERSPLEVLWIHQSLVHGSELSGLDMKEWSKVLRDHKTTLKQVEGANGLRMSKEEVKELQLMATEAGISLHLIDGSMFFVID